MEHTYVINTRIKTLEHVPVFQKPDYCMAPLKAVLCLPIHLMNFKST